jgi:hypothetical protein
MREMLRGGHGNWCWVYCDNPRCGHRAPMAMAPLGVALPLHLRRVDVLDADALAVEGEGVTVCDV